MTTQVKTGVIADAAITTEKIADGAITSAKILDGTIATDDIADSSITSAKIADGTIVDGDISTTAAIAKTKISGTAITASDTGTVTGTMIADGTITGTDIANSTIGIGKLSATGTPSATTYLRGDNTWGTPAGGGSGTVNSGTSGQLAYYAASGSAVSGGLTPTTAGNVLFTADGSVWSSTQKIVQGASVSASGTSVSFTGIPSWVKRIIVMLSGISTSGTSNLQIQLGTSGGFITSGYSSGVAAITSAGGSSGAVSVTTGFFTNTFAANTDTISGTYIINSFGGNIWAYTGTGLRAGNVASFFNAAAPFSLGAALTQIRLTTVNGTDTFDAGSVNILYE